MVQTMPEEMLLQDEHKGSGRVAILDDYGIAGWLYLTERGGGKTEADAWVYNRIAAPSMAAIKSFHGGPPPAAKGYASKNALCLDPLAHEWAFLWSSDGEAVAITKDGEPVAFIVAG